MARRFDSINHRRVAGEMKRAYMTVTAALGWIALVLQFYITFTTSLANGKSAAQAIVLYFSFFTILTNLLVALVLTSSVRAPDSSWGRFFSRPVVASGTAAYIVIVGVTYSLLLRETWDPTGLQKIADFLLHDLIPVLYVAYWTLFVAKETLRWRNLVTWLAYPLVYVTFVLVRGAATGVYPYPFLDAGNLGYLRVLANAIGLLVAFLVTGSLVVAIGRWMARRRPAESK
jgi:hypothetical protein